VRVPPLAVAEVQGYAYQARREAARLLAVVDADGTRARRDEWVARAAALEERFDACFWLPDRRFYALALDANGAPLAARASNIGHCLSTGIVRVARLADVVRGLMAEDMFSGWGVRTLSSDNPGYDPFSYHRGAVWPAENAMIAHGLRACGHHAEAERVTTAQLALAAGFQHMRLPEVLSGHARTPSDPFPGIYNFANPLQAWSISAIARHLQSILGVWPRADQRALYLDPHLPPWLDWLELHDLDVGGERVSLRFRRGRDRTTWEPIGAPPSLALRGGPRPSFG
jgi:glycogen debranching enzyme